MCTYELHDGIFWEFSVKLFKIAQKTIDVAIMLCNGTRNTEYSHLTNYKIKVNC